MTGPSRRVVLVTGAAGAAGPSVCSALQAAGAKVVAVEYNRQVLEPLTAAVPGLSTDVADLTDPAAVAELAARVHEQHGTIDGLVHLVGGYRGGSGFASNTDGDWRLLSALLVDTLRPPSASKPSTKSVIA